MTEFLILTKVRKMTNKISTFQRAPLACSQHCLGESLGKQSIETKEDWKYFKKIILKEHRGRSYLYAERQTGEEEDWPA